MSAIEKICKLSLALDRIYRHGHIFLNDDIATDYVKEAISYLQDAIARIGDWDEFIEKESRWWIDLTDEKCEEEE
jgi:hypothetical protein